MSTPRCCVRLSWLPALGAAAADEVLQPAAYSEPHGLATPSHPPGKGLAPAQPPFPPLPPLPAGGTDSASASGMSDTVEAGRLVLRGVLPKMGRFGESLLQRP
jgi:hypothetical protein